MSEQSPQIPSQQESQARKIVKIQGRDFYFNEISGAYELAAVVDALIVEAVSTLDDSTRDEPVYTVDAGVWRDKTMVTDADSVDESVSQLVDPEYDDYDDDQLAYGEAENDVVNEGRKLTWVGAKEAYDNLRHKKSVKFAVGSLAVMSVIGVGYVATDQVTHALTGIDKNNSPIEYVQEMSQTFSNLGDIVNSTDGAFEIAKLLIGR
ncbi:MAG: hypothetical protein ABIR91_03535 [Candidatus Saccharimonadales bacterium]